MVELAPKSTCLNSLGSIIYCIIAIGVQIYIAYDAITDYNQALLQKWTGGYPLELGMKLGLAIVGLMFIPLFIATCVFRVGNYANDGYKLGRDHALYPLTGLIVNKINNDIVKRLWQHFCPFSQTLHLLIALCLLLPETMCTAAEVKHGLKSPDYVWTSDLDFLFTSDRHYRSDVIGRLNETLSEDNTTVIVNKYLKLLITSNHAEPVSVAFLNFVFAFIAFSIRYASVFWYTNKGLAFIFVTQLLFMSINSLFTFAGITVLYKISSNILIYERNVHLILGNSAIMGLYIGSGVIVLFSTIIIFEYGSHYFREKFEVFDRKHNPESYVKQSIIVKGPCNGYVTHTCAMVALAFMVCLKGPLLYDLISVYRVTKDGLLLSSIVVDVCYLVFWILFWILLTIKQQWLFRILDYAPVGQTIFMIKSDSLIKTPSISVGSIELKDVHMHKRKRPSSLPSCDITPSESGFDEGEQAPSSEDERFELSLPPVSENPNGSMDHLSANDIVMRRNRNRRSVPQRVTFHDTVRHSFSSDDIGRYPPRSRSSLQEDPRMMNVIADVHGGQGQSRRSPYRHPEIANIRATDNYSSARSFNPGRRYSARDEYLSNGNDICGSSDDIRSNISEPVTVRPIYRRRVRSAERPPRVHSYAEGRTTPQKQINDYTYKPSNIQKAEEMETRRQIEGLLNSHESDGSRETITQSNQDNSDSQIDKEIMKIIDNKKCQQPFKEKQPDIVPKDNSSSNKFFPRPLKFVPKKSEITRRDSANYSMTSSQDTSSNESDPNHPSLCSQV
ncbi:hypothetical protein KUTeg_004852 [Tegillarca granosa]|uniref:Protein tincar n=1 Tax=Tegillarca granosa TaxID=220873 RepID=A0ABQ9FML1_TEGGR|nr:hypothetical protein KUTeg_004852 [Tegillarca granosa]